MNIIKKGLKYISIVLIGIFLAFFVARIQYDTQDLSASVLSLTEQHFFESTKWDAGYKKENQNFEIFLSNQVKDEGTLVVSIIYSPQNINLFIDQINTKYSVNVIEQNQGNLILNVEGYQNGNFSEGIFELPYSGDSKEITLEYIKSKNLDFAIGNLDNINTENQTH